MAKGFSMGGLLVSLSVIGMGFAVSAVLQHTPIFAHWSSMGVPEAQALESIQEMQPPQNTVAAFDPSSLTLPAGYQPQWREISLDGQTVAVLGKPFALKQTHNGSEYFAYSAGVFHQMAYNAQQRSPQGKLAEQLQALSMSAQHMGYGVEEAWHARFEGVPTEDMQHIRVHEMLSRTLGDLNPQALIKLDYNQDGRLMSTQKTDPDNARTGAALAEFHERLNAVLANPESKQYPQTMALLKRQAALLDSLSSHLSMHYENTLYCGTGNHQSGCEHKAMYVRLYATQTLPQTAVAQAFQ